MKEAGLMQKGVGLVQHGFTRPAENAAGRMGLFRILYALFYLWHLSWQYADRLVVFPRNLVQSLILSDILPSHLLPALEVLLVVALVLLAFGLFTRTMTALVLVAGSILEARYVAIGGHHHTVFLACFIPLFMLICGDWGSVCSVDAWKRRCSGREVVAPSDATWTHVLPARCLLVILAVLFVTAGLYKIKAAEFWILNPDTLSLMMIEKNIMAARLARQLNPFAPFLADHLWIGRMLQYGVVVLECTFFLALLNGRLGRLYLGVAVIFHSISALLLNVSFTAILVVYFAFIDWQAIWNRFPLSRVSMPKLNHARVTMFVAVVIAVACACGLLWNHTYGLRHAVNVCGLIDDTTIWYPVLVIALFQFVRDLIRPS